VTGRYLILKDETAEIDGSTNAVTACTNGAKCKLVDCTAGSTCSSLSISSYISLKDAIFKCTSGECENITVPGYYKVDDNSYHSIKYDGTVDDIGSTTYDASCTVAGKLKEDGTLCLGDGKEGTFSGGNYLADNTAQFFSNEAASSKLAIKAETAAFILNESIATGKFNHNININIIIK